MALNSDRLTLWELAHRWNGADPHLFDDLASIPLEVKDTLRVLAAEIYFERLYSDLLLGRERGRMNQKLLKMKLKKSIDDYADQFTSCIEKNVIDKEFLGAVMIPFWELQYWCKEYTIPFPEFWISPMWREESYIPLPGVSRPSKPSVNEDEPPQKTDTGQQAATEKLPDTELSASIDGAVSERSRKAAYARHEPISQLKRELVNFWEEGEFKNQVDAVRKFYNTLPTEKQRLFSADNWEVTLSKALSDHINDRSATWRSKPLPQ